MPFFDLQVNGYAGVDFNQDSLSAEQLHTACERLQADGVTGILATIVTEKLERMETRLRRIVQIRDQDPLVRTVIAGIHIEGPFINETDGYRGAHPRDSIMPATPDAMNQLLDAAGGLTRIVTLAPERDPGMTVTRLLASQNIVISAGHCDASLNELRAAIDAGLTMFTHVGNGCPMNLPRHDNIVQRVLSLSDKIWLCFIADGVHVPFFALRNYIRLAGVERCVVVTDAMAAAGLGPGRYTLGRWDLVVGEDLAARAPDGSHLVGSAGTMPRSFQNLVEQSGFTGAEANQLMYENPRQSIQC